MCFYMLHDLFNTTVIVYYVFSLIAFKLFNNVAVSEMFSTTGQVWLHIFTLTKSRKVIGLVLIQSPFPTNTCVEHAYSTI